MSEESAASLAQDELTTADLVHAAARAFNRTHTELKTLIAEVRRLEKHVAKLKTAAQPPRAVVVHGLPPLDAQGRPVKRGPGRPKGAVARNHHVFVRPNGHAPTP